MKKGLITMCAAVLCAATCALALTACGDGSSEGSSSGQVTAEQWGQRLSFEGKDNFTASIITSSTYPEEEAEKYGEWQRVEYTYYVDNVSGNLIYNSVIKRWVDESVRQENGESVVVPAHFETYSTNWYYFAQGGRYYGARYYVTYGTQNDDTGSWSGGEITLADYTRQFETITDLSAALSMYSDPFMMQAFNYNQETGMYEMISMGSTSIAIKFGDNSVSQVTNAGSLVSQTVTISDVDSTVVEIPQNAEDAALGGTV